MHDISLQIILWHFFLLVCEFSSSWLMMALRIKKIVFFRESIMSFIYHSVDSVERDAVGLRGGKK